MNVTIDLPPDVADRLSRRAAQGGQDLAGFMQHLAAREAGGRDADLAAWDALIDSFAEGDPDDHRDTVDTLAKALNEDRPGQRRVFGAGINPPAPQPS